MIDITVLQLRRLAPFAKQWIIAGLVENAPDVLPTYSITTPLRIAHFMAQIAHESAGFRTLEEYASGQAYEGRKDLGNTEVGDGRRYKGRGYIQLTGRANYIEFGARIGIDLANRPWRAQDPRIALLLACEYWKSRRLNARADRNDIRTITRKINGGYNGLRDRKKKFNKAWSIWGSSAKRPWFGNMPMLKRGMNGPAVETLQAKLKTTADGIFGSGTERAVKAFQRKTKLKSDGIVGVKTWGEVLK